MRLSPAQRTTSTGRSERRITLCAVLPGTRPARSLRRVHDRYQNYDSFPCLIHQICAAHIIRDLEDAAESYRTRTGRYARRCRAHPPDQPGPRPGPARRPGRHRRAADPGVVDATDPCPAVKLPSRAPGCSLAAQQPSDGAESAGQQYSPDDAWTAMARRSTRK